MADMLSPLTPPTLRDDLPRYPPLLQLLRVTSTTVPGPLGYAGTSSLAAALYVASTQQLRTDSLLPRDREPCLADDVRQLGVTPGYHLGRLAGSHNGLPVYEIIDQALSSVVGLAQGMLPSPAPVGVSSTTVDELLLVLSPTQKATLANLTPCQVAVLLTTLNISQVARLTASATPTQLYNLVVTTPTVAPGRPPVNTQDLVNGLTINQILRLTTSLTNQQVTELTSSLTTAQILQLTNALNITQLTNVVNKLTMQQLVNLVTATSTSQLTSITSSLTVAQLQTLGRLTSEQITRLVVNLTSTQITNLLTLFTSGGSPGGGDTLIANLLGGLTDSQLSSVSTNLSMAQLTVLGGLTRDQIAALVPGLTTPQLQTLTTGLPTARQIQNLTDGLTSAQTVSVLGGLTQSQLQTLAKYPPSTTNTLVLKLSLTDLATVLNSAPPTPSPLIGNQANFPFIPAILGRPSSTPLTAQGYRSVVVDGTTGAMYAYSDSGWEPVGGSGGGGGGATLTNYAGTTPADGSTANVFTITNADGVHGSFSVYNVDAMNNLDVYVSNTDMESNVVTQPLFTAIPPGNAVGFDINALGPAAFGVAPFSSFTLQVRSFGGTPATPCDYRAYLSRLT